MITVTLYKNNFHYPKFSRSLTKVGNDLQCTPLNINSTSGEILTQNFSELHNANYISLDIDNTLLYAWIDSIEHYSGDKRYKIKYSVDAFRTYIDKVELGTQFIKRSPTISRTLDPMLRGDSSFKEVEVVEGSFLYSSQRTLVVITAPAIGAANDALENLPLQPSPYYVHLINYDTNNWKSTTPIVNLMDKLRGQSRAINLINMYSTPYIELTGFLPSSILLDFNGSTESISGFSMFKSEFLSRLSSIVALPIPVDLDITQTPHVTQLLIPEAGTITLPPEFADEHNDNPTVALQRTIDIYSGSCNYAVIIQSGGNDYLTPYSLRAPAVTTIPLAYNPEQQLNAINQTNKLTSMLGDVGSIAFGGASLIGGLASAPATGGVSLGLAFTGAMQAGSSLVDAFTRDDAMKDSLSNHSYPSSLLGSALLPHYNGKFYIIITKTRKDNANEVHELYGYPQNKLMTLTLPTKGFIQTQECNVSGAIPKWAIEEINNHFNQGISIQ